MKNQKELLNILRELATYGFPEWDGETEKEDFKHGYRSVNSGLICRARRFCKENGIEFKDID